MQTNEEMKKEEQEKVEQIIKETQDLAKKLGHCLCNLKLQCPCEDYINDKTCPCSEYKIKAMKNKLNAKIIQNSNSCHSDRSGGIPQIQE
jgi:Cft2 family RNA processing exonuclease